MTSTPAKVRQAITAQGRLNEAARKANDLAAKRDALVYDAQQEGATYTDLAAALDLSSARVTQILRRERDRRIPATTK